jgi:Family of unknown function (DUF6527)
VNERARYTHELVVSFPDEPRDGVLYVSIKFATAMHRCMCGCGEQVITPLTPTDWRLTYNGETVSLAPSIGNWSMRCQSHYWLDDGHVRWAGRWTLEQISAGRAHDRLTKAQAFGEAIEPDGAPALARQRELWWRRLRERLRPRS